MKPREEKEITDFVKDSVKEVVSFFIRNTYSFLKEKGFNDDYIKALITTLFLETLENNLSEYFPDCVSIYERYLFGSQ
jgi:hypothetical protein